MNSFRNHRLRDHTLPMSTAWLLNDIAEAKGRQELYTRQSPQGPQALREMALIQSAESSNRIEGVTVAADRLRPLVLGNTRLRDPNATGNASCQGRARLPLLLSGQRARSEMDKPAALG